MVNKPKRIGTQAESAVVKWLRLNGFPMADRQPLRGNRDAGDVAVAPGLVFEVKSVRTAGTGQPGASLLADWMAQAAAERDNAAADLCPLVVKRAGSGDPARWWAYTTQGEFLTLLGLPVGRAPHPNAWVCMTLASLAALLRAAGYGEKWPSRASGSLAEPRAGSAGTHRKDQARSSLRRGSMTTTDFDLNAFAAEVHANAVAKGFWPEDGRPWGETIALIHSELSEALEEHRAGRPRVCWEQYLDHERGYKIREGLPNDEEVKPEGWAVELADAAIRCLDAIAEAGAIPDWTHGAYWGVADFPSRIAHIHAGVTDSLRDGRARVLWPTVLRCLDLIGEDWPEILRAKHAYNLTRPVLHGKAY